MHLPVCTIFMSALCNNWSNWHKSKRDFSYTFLRLYLHCIILMMLKVRIYTENVISVRNEFRSNERMISVKLKVIDQLMEGSGKLHRGIFVTVSVTPFVCVPVEKEEIIINKKKCERFLSQLT